MSIYKAVNAITDELAKSGGIAKERKNAAQGFQFRGIDDVYNHLAPLLKKHGVVIIPNVEERIVTERTSDKGKVMFHVVLRMIFRFVSAEDATEFAVQAYGEAMDLGDKATSKAMSMAYKSAVLQTFAIPTEGDNDADATTHTVTAEPTSDPALLKEYLEMIVSAPDLDMLKDVYNEASKWARDNNDKVGYTQIVNAKNARKAVLEKGAENE